jgi:CRP-like cAMP-binding protein
MVEGKLLLETCIEIDSYTKFPCGAKEWEIKKKTKKIIYKLREISAGDYFGHEEIILGVDRRVQARAITNCTLLYVNKDKFFSCFPKPYIETMKKNMENMFMLDIDLIVDRIKKQND